MRKGIIMCGIFGVVGSKMAVPETIRAIQVLEHRGPGGAGIAGIDFSTDNEMKTVKAFGEAHKSLCVSPGLADIQGRRAAIGHCLYMTTASKAKRRRLGAGFDARYLHPFYAVTTAGKIALAENGDLVNADAERAWLQSKGMRLYTESDAEVIAASITFHLAQKGLSLLQSVAAAMGYLQGGYSVVLLSEMSHELIGFRDPFGVRPLWIGKRKEGKRWAWYLSSETVALYEEVQKKRIRIVRQVRPGEIVALSEKSGRIKSVQALPATPRHCIFEWDYFCRPSSLDSINPARSFYSVRVELGRVAARKAREQWGKWFTPDVVIGTPLSGIPAAIGAAAELGVLYHWLMEKNPSRGRTFNVEEALRSQYSAEKYVMIADMVAGKNVAILDDSIVRGTTMKVVIRHLRKLGAKKIYVISTFPPYLHDCYYGIDTKDPEEYIARNRTPEQVAEFLGCDGVYYQTVEDLVATVGLPASELCLACINGQYPHLGQAN